MRKSFINSLTQLAEKDKRIFLMTGDLGFSVFEDFQSKFPDRFIDAGVAEQNMIGVAAGLALTDKIVYAYSIVPFITMRCFEQIRNDICYHDLNVRLIGIGGGFVYGSAGLTHHSLEDISIMRSLPNMTVIAPGDPVEAFEAIKASADHKGPMYIRLAKGGEITEHTSISFKIGKGIIVSEGSDITLVSSANTLSLTKKVSEGLKAKGLSVRLISMPTIKPLDEQMILDSIGSTKALFTLEEHGIIGGLGSAVADIVAEKGKGITFKSFALQDSTKRKVGSQQFLLNEYGLSYSYIMDNILKRINK
jgi:transketolase